MEELVGKPSRQIDTDAGSTKKRGRYYFGYKMHNFMDAGSKLIRKQCFTYASSLDPTAKDQFWSGDVAFVSRESAYSKLQEKRLSKKLGIYYGILKKATRKHKLSNPQKARNRKKSGVRSAVEHPYYFIKEKLGFVCCWTKNLERSALGFTMNCVVYNLMRAGYLIARG